jgi:hypothetical protein
MRCHRSPQVCERDETVLLIQQGQCTALAERFRQWAVTTPWDWRYRMHGIHIDDKEALLVAAALDAYRVSIK